MYTEERIADRVRLLALYLPQFHRVRENDEWWGEGFTEWTAVREAKPLFPGHRQPQHPLNDNYYDLLEKDTMIWQVSLAKKYRVDGFCFYHYYFKDGRKILEKPAENLLKWQEIDMPFCFNWANESWARTWKKFAPGKNVNVWTAKGGKNDSGSNILLQQEYGTEPDWDEHFEYLLPFFKDKRYVKLAGKPVFMIHQPEEIICLASMAKRWDELAKKEGFPGIYMIGDEVKSPFEQPVSALQGRMLHFPTVSLVQTEPESRENDLLQFDYRKLCQIALSYDTELADGRASYYCLGPGFDTTPRSGSQGCVLINRSADVFRKTLAEMVARSRKKGLAFLFLNAWNEWGESMHLEPDEEDGYAYLEAIKEVVEQDKVTSLQPAVISDKEVGMMKLISLHGGRAYRATLVRRYLNIWLSWLQSGGGLAKYLRARGYHRIAIYGYGNMGKHVLRELKEENFVPVCLIDQKADSMEKSIPVMRLHDDWPEIDAILVSPLWHNSEIFYDIRKRINVPIIFLREILDEAYVHEID